MIENQHILFAALNWGNGHLSRSIGLIRKLLEKGNTIHFAGNEDQQAIILNYFPTIETHLLIDYPFRFSGKGNFSNDLYQGRNELLSHIKQEYLWVKNFIASNPLITAVISDHRYGFYSEDIPSIFVTHQVKLAIKWWQFPVQYLHKMLLSPFSEVWIVDDAKKRYAGKLSQAPKSIPFQYIGILSRFETEKNKEKEINLGVVNGPQPYAEHLFNRLLKNNDLDYLIVPSFCYFKSLDKRLVNAGDWGKIDEYFYKAKSITAYSGYSTLMDCLLLKCEMNLKPTKGQTEQEYLFQLHYGKKKR